MAVPCHGASAARLSSLTIGSGHDQSGHADEHPVYVTVAA